MKSVEEKADEIHSILSTTYLHRLKIEDPDFIKKHLHKAVVISRAGTFQQMIRKIIFKESKDMSKKTFSVVKHVKGDSCSLSKEIENAKRCHGNHSFRLSYLERLLLEDQINLREFKQLKAVLIKKQLQSISELSKKNQNKSLSLKSLKSLSKTSKDHINPYHK